ncbi:MAG: DUF2797 domain-containing protein [Promethearchaeota archaeon]|nr:MAG: DUF2797 domain-containing protein [Candidatus Lokiarchaeota archaeon]
MHCYRKVVDVWVPYLQVVDNYGGRQLVPFIGNIFLDVSRERYCLECYKRIDSSRSLCDECLQEKNLYFLKCVIDGVGLGRGWCDLEDPECGSEFCSNYCSREHAVYIAQFGNDYTKVGVSRRDRVWLRLIEQGVSRAQVFVGDEPLNLVSAQLIETCIKEYFKIEPITDHLEFERKLPVFIEEEKDLELNSMDSITREITKIFNIHPWFTEDFRKYYNFVEIDESRYHAGRLDGVLVGYRGNILNYKDQNGIIWAFNANSMSGRCLLNVKG